MTIAAELWLRGRIETLEAVFQAAAIFSRPTPLGFRQVVQHVQLHVA